MKKSTWLSWTAISLTTLAGVPLAASEGTPWDEQQD